MTPRNPDARFASALARRVAGELAAVGWQLERVSTDSGNEFHNQAFDAELEHLGARHTHISPGRPQSNGFVERVQRTILEECWKPAFARYLVPKYVGLRRELVRYLEHYNFDRTHNGRLTQGRIPAEVLGAAKMYRWQGGCVATSWGLYSLGPSTSAGAVDDRGDAAHEHPYRLRRSGAGRV